MDKSSTPNPPAGGSSQIVVDDSQRQMEMQLLNPTEPSTKIKQSKKKVSEIFFDSLATSSSSGSPSDAETFVFAERRSPRTKQA